MTDRYVDLRGSMIRRWMIDVPTFEDRWSLCRPSKIDDRCEIILLHLLKTLMVYLYANNCAEGLHFSAFIVVVLCVCMCVRVHSYLPPHTLESNNRDTNGFTAIQRSF